MKEKIAIKRYISAGILSIALLASYSILVKAEETTDPANEELSASGTIGITFPIPELGNCENKTACKAYCENSANISQCVAFSEAHGLINKERAEQGRKFGNALRESGGPGGCTSPQACSAFCSNIQNVEVCTKFAEDHGIKNESVNRGRKLANHITSGGTTPGNCNSEESCKTYCADFAHADECLAFRKKIAGDKPGDDTQIKKLSELAAAGQTPGGCTSKDACETYCKDDSHREECLSFGERAGLLKKDQADKLRISGRNGPGGCDSKESCEIYCNEESHHEECLSFGTERGLIKPEEARSSREGLLNIRSGIENAPTEVQACIASVIGKEALDKIQSGTLIPGPEIGGKVKDCFERFGKRTEIQEIFKRLPAPVLSCVKERLGSETFSNINAGKEQPGAEISDAIRICAEESRLKQADERNTSNPRPKEAITNFLRTAPPAIVPCIKEKLGDDFEKIQTNQTTGEIDTAKLKTCFEEFRAKNPEPARPTGTIKIPPINRPGPGGCKNADECRAYCLNPEHKEECAKQNVLPKSDSAAPTTSPVIGNQQESRSPSSIVSQCIRSILGENTSININIQSLAAEQKTKLGKCISEEQLKRNPPPYPGGKPPPPPSQQLQERHEPTGGNIFDVFQQLFKYLSS